LKVDREYFRAGETETVRDIFTLRNESESKKQRRPNTVAG
jgi:hypothetical protein